MIPVYNRKVDYEKITPSMLYVGRPSPLGNPFVIAGRDTREDVIAMFSIYAGLCLDEPEFLEALRQASQATGLICWCAPQACHADVIAELCEIVPL